jgi:hypothetical protein
MGVQPSQSINTRVLDKIVNFEGMTKLGKTTAEKAGDSGYLIKVEDAFNNRLRLTEFHLNERGNVTKSRSTLLACTGSGPNSETIIRPQVNVPIPFTVDKVVKAIQEQQELMKK